jgi:hypothetical protein
MKKSNNDIQVSFFNLFLLIIALHIIGLITYKKGAVCFNRSYYTAPAAPSIPNILLGSVLIISGAT